MKLYLEKRRFFPDPAAPTLDGIVAMGDELSAETLFEAYSFGIFPWPHSDLPCLWFCPDNRGVIDFKEIHINRSLQKFIRKTNFKITFNQAFTRVIRECAESPRVGQNGTWITPQIIKVYENFHKQGYVHSVECWEGSELVGGLYGVYVAGVFSGESMFFKKSNASKFCLLKLIEKLQEHGLAWMDIQMLTEVTKSLGGKYIAKAEYLSRIESSKKNAKSLFVGGRLFGI